MPTPVPRKRPSKYVPGQVYCTPASVVLSRPTVLAWSRTLDGGAGLVVVDALGVGLEPGAVGSTVPVHGTPLSAKVPGTGFAALVSEPPKPNEVEAPVPSVPFQVAFATVTSA